jgi:hypothetical protein
VLETMSHRQRGIRLTVERASDHRDRLPRNEFADKRDSAPPVIDIFSADIKTQIHFLEIAMQWNGQAEDSRVEEEESNDAQERSSLMKNQALSRTAATVPGALDRRRNSTSPGSANLR